jgi:hypothetical protein
MNRDDRVLPTTRALSAFIAPFLLVAFVLLYGFPGQTARLWAWPIQSQMTSMLLASAYLGGCYFFLRVLLAERHWAAVRAGLVSVALFATLLAVATGLHWDKFAHGSPAFWLWCGLYFTAPVLVAAAGVANQRTAAPADPDAPRLGRVPRTVVAGIGGLALITGIALFLAPVQAISYWPWPLTPLTCRVVGATFCLGSAGLAVLVDDRWDTVRLMRQVQLVMFTAILAAAVRVRGEFLTDRPLTWVMAAGFLALFAATLASSLPLKVDPATPVHRHPSHNFARHTAAAAPAPTGAQHCGTSGCAAGQLPCRGGQHSLLGVCRPSP